MQLPEAKWREPLAMGAKQDCIFLLEARAKEFLEVVSRKAKRKRKCAAAMRGTWLETAINHFVETRSQCDLDVGRAKPIFRLVEARNWC